MLEYSNTDTFTPLHLFVYSVFKEVCTAMLFCHSRDSTIDVVNIIHSVFIHTAVIMYYCAVQLQHFGIVTLSSYSLLSLYAQKIEKIGCLVILVHFRGIVNIELSNHEPDS